MFIPQVKHFESTQFESRQPIGASFGDLDVPNNIKDSDYKLTFCLEISETRVTQTHEIAP